MKLLFITATNTDIGKTYASLQLIEGFSKEKIRVGICKPIETGVVDNPVDATKLLEKVQQYNSEFLSLKPKDITAYTFSLPASPFCADKDNIIEIEKIKQKVMELSKLCDLLIIEGAGGLMVPITQNYMMIDLAEELEAFVLLVTPSKLGCINDTLLSIEMLKNRDINFDWCVNMFQDKNEFKQITKPFYDELFPKWWSLQENLDNYIKKFNI
ncbi:MAG: dethiobiotin synthase [Sulfurovaceae bacterium]|nr:dethiobiotin synthase [Sulfurovaceae bacterium]